MKEYIKILDDLRPEEIRFHFDPLNKNLCFGGSTPTLPKIKIKLPEIKIGGSAGDLLDKGKDAAGEAAAAAKAATAAAATKAKEAAAAAATKAKEVAHTAATKTKQNVHGLATDAKAEFARQADAGKAALHAAADQGKEWMQKLGLAKTDEPTEAAAAAKATPGGTEKVGEGGKIAMREAVASKGKKAKAGAKGKRALRKVGATV
jgi:hypothetical protein